MNSIHRAFGIWSWANVSIKGQICEDHTNFSACPYSNDPAWGRRGRSYIRYSIWNEGAGQARQTLVKVPFDFGHPSPINQQVYKYKAVEVVFANEADEFVVVTVKVYYFNQEVK